MPEASLLRPRRTPAPETVLLRQCVAVDDIRIEAFIGVHGHEHDRRQSLIVAVELDIVAPPTDTIGDTIDYNRVVAAARTLADEGIALIETFSRRLAEVLMSDPRVVKARVLVTKPGALPNGVARASVVLARP
jgi:dihydroneopterin aldolase